VENWLGYFVGESVMPYEAFADIWDDITMIKTKSWCAFRSSEEGDYWGLRVRSAAELWRYGYCNHKQRS
jgi:hypothetical protein